MKTPTPAIALQTTPRSDAAPIRPIEDVPTPDLGEKNASSVPSAGRIDLFNQVGVSAIALIVYAMTMCRSIYTGDDGDFLTAMATNGNCHPTGYPLFLILGKVALALFAPFFPDPATRTNLLTVLCGSAAVGFFYRFLASLKIERYLAWTGALILAFSPTLWQQSLSVEVYALTAAFLSGLLWQISTWSQEPSDHGRLRRLTFFYGLACTNHLTLVLFLPFFFALALYRRPTLFGKEWPVLLSMVGLFVLPLSLYAYLPWSAAQNPPVNWGDPSTPALFYEKISGAQYRMAMFHSFDIFRDHALEYFRVVKNGQFDPGLLASEFGGYLLWLAPVGLIGFWKQRSRPLLLLLVAIASVNLLFSFNYNIFDIYVYYIPSYIVITTFIIAGVSFLLSRIFDRLQLSTDRRKHYQNLFAAVSIMLPIVHMSMNYAATDQSGNRMESDFSYNIFQSAPRNAIIITIGSQTFSLWYRKYVLHERPDLTVINVSLMEASLVQNGWYYKHLQSQYPDIDRTYPNRPVTHEEALSDKFLLATIDRAISNGTPVIWVANTKIDTLVNEKTKEPLGQRLAKQFDRRSYGAVERLYKKGQTPSDEQLFLENRQIWPKLHFEKLLAWAHADHLQEPIALRYAEAFTEWGSLCERTGHPDLAVAAYRNAQTLYVVPKAQAGLERLGAGNEPTTDIVPVPPEGTTAP